MFEFAEGFFIDLIIYTYMKTISDMVFVSLALQPIATNLVSPQERTRGAVNVRL